MTERRMLIAGAVAGPLFVGCLAIQGALRVGFRFRDHPPSALELGHAGLLGQATFVCAGLLLVVGSVGLRHAGFRRGISRLVAVLGCSLAAAGLFTMDPAFGFPPGTRVGVGPVSWHAALHGALFPVGFIALVGAAGLMGRDYGRKHRRGMQVLTYAAASSSFLLSMWPNLAAKPDGRFLPMWFGVGIAYLWTSLIFADALRDLMADAAAIETRTDTLGPSTRSVDS